MVTMLMTWNSCQESRTKKKKMTEQIVIWEYANDIYEGVSKQLTWKNKA